MFFSDDPIIHQPRLGTSESPFKKFSEPLIIDNSAKVHLTEYPSQFHKVFVTGGGVLNWFETTQGNPNENSYYVDYTHKTITFHISNIGKQLVFEYHGKGNSTIPASSIYTEREGLTVTETLQELINNNRNISTEAQQFITSAILAEQERAASEASRKTDETSRQSAESARVLKENARDVSENQRGLEEGVRKSNETARIASEATRESAEITRKSNEVTRANSESDRTLAETTRNADESSRKLSEADRNTSEITRISNETARGLSEASRVTKENERSTAETSRVNSENTRVANETSRQSNETTRQNQEVSRKTSEDARVLAETDRITKESTRITAENKRQTDTATAITNAETATTNATNAYNSAKTIVDNTKFVEEWNNLATYKVNNIVSYNGSSFISLLDNNIGNVPDVHQNTLYWALMAQRGVDGTGSVAKVNNVSPTPDGNVALTPLDINAVSKPEFDTLSLTVADKVNKETGKGLSNNNYTTPEKDKLAGVESGANNYTHPLNHPPSIITQDASNRFVTDMEKAEWNSKETVSGSQIKIDSALTTAKTYSDGGIETHNNSFMPHDSELNQYATAMDANGIYTVIEYKRVDGTLYLKSTLSLPNTDGLYTKCVWEFYNNSGTLVELTKTWTFTIGLNGIIESKVVL